MGWGPSETLSTTRATFSLLLKEPLAPWARGAVSISVTLTP